MKILTFIISFFFLSLAHGGEWKVVDKATLFFQGSLDASDLVKFQEVFTSDISKLIVDSGGGNAEVGLAIGEILTTAKVEIEVQGICMSSCANYIFTAGRQKILNRGIVGYHGNMTALVHSVGKEALIKQMKDSGLTDQQAHDLINKFLDETLPREQKFFQRLGISQDLFDRTQRMDKGMGSGVYSALLPKPNTFLKYGIPNVHGEQSQDVIKTDPRVTKYADLGTPVVLD